MNRIQSVLEQDKKLLSIYFTAGFPNLNDTVSILKQLEVSGVDMIELGLPFSDPLADGPTIQESSTQALRNGMTTDKLFEQLKDVRKQVSVPLIVMGYFNPMMQYGVERFCQRCQKVGIDGLIVPDLPVDVYHEKYQTLFQQYGLLNMFLITPQTPDERIRFIDEVSDGFIYMVSSAATTGAQSSFGDAQADYFKRIGNMNLKAKLLVGFGISNAETYEAATAHSKGAIIGSAFIKHLDANGVNSVADFIKQIR
ncbi:MAG: tryptophan synthase subunit alpha [Bacteroidetes bacterium]|nr:tryptophan synthase subunit alpha [Bacteroidota bacterium]MDA0889117.1 tryptophan synthase subunit alpha [Bacteroidota bacterium]MDA1084917.1 tryptophan synthase subunit alpha [Bacteroidota bacterium]